MFTHGRSVSIHCVGIIIIYLCQGLVQSTMGLVPLTLVHLNKTFSTATIGLLGLPIYAFSLKFLWAPIVDMVHFFGGTGVVPASKAHPSNVSQFLHRRLQWVILTHLCMALGYWYLYCFAATKIEEESERGNVALVDSWSSVANERTSAYVLVIILGVLCVSSSTQDVAVDAWAVEGLSTNLQGMAGSLQTVGLLVGSLLTTLFLGLHTATDDGSSFPVSIYFAASGGVCVLGILAGFVVAYCAPLKQECAAADGSVGEIKSFLRTPSVRDFVAFLLTKGVASAANTIASYELIRLNWSNTNLASSLSLMSTLTSLFTAFVIVPKVLLRWAPAVVLRVVSGAFLLIQGLSFALYIFTIYFGLFGWGGEVRMNSEGDVQGTDSVSWKPLKASEGQQLFYFYAVSIPQTILNGVVGTILFVAVAGQIAKEAAPFPKVTGTAVTVLNSIGNMGGSIPSSLVMFGFPPVLEFVGLDRSLVIVGFVAAVLLSGALLRHTILLPALNRIIEREKSQKQKRSD